VTQRVDSIVITRSIEGLLYAWRNELKCVVHKPLYIDKYSEEYDGLDFSFLNAENANQLWSNLSFAMALSGLLLCPDNIENIRHVEDGIDIVSKGQRIMNIKSDKILNFDEKIQDSFDVYDFFDTRSTKVHDHWQIDDDSDFVRRINFYVSPRIGVKKCTKDFVSLSRMTQKELLDPDYGNAIVRLKAMRMMSDNGITGPLSVRTETKTYYKKPKVDFYKRIVSERTKKIFSFKEVYDMEQARGDSWKMIQKLKAR
jgi:hypothetical protein